MAMQEMCKVVCAETLADGIFSLTFEAPRLCAAAQAGQFVHVACGAGNLLRRPISICDIEGDTMRIIYQVKGEGTRWLSERKPGEVLDVLGPLGHGFDLEALGARPVCIGGGIGVPPMLYTMKRARALGAEPTAITGFRTRGLVILEHEFSQQGALNIATDDGTYGIHGFVSDVLRSTLPTYTGVAACGPRPMLRAVAAVAEEAGLPCQVSMEERMGCGIGACLVCACELKLRDGEEGVRYGHVCKDGPVFDSKEVVW